MKTLISGPDAGADSTSAYLRDWRGEPYAILSTDENHIWQAQTGHIYHETDTATFWPGDVIYRMHHNDWDRMLEKILYNLYMGGYQHIHSDLVKFSNVYGILLIISKLDMPHMIYAAYPMWCIQAHFYSNKSY